MEGGDNDPVLTIVKWEDFLQDYSKDGDYIHGFVTDETSVDSVLELYRRATKTTFCTRRSSSLQFDPLKCPNKKFCTRSFVFCRSTCPRISDDGVPFTYGGMKTLECQYGPKREHRKKSDIETFYEEKINHNYTELKTSKQRLSTGVTRKKGCQAKISVWHICRLPEYVVTAKKSVTIWQTKAKERLLRDLEAGKEVVIESRFYISFPLQRAHTEHTPSGRTDEAHSVHPQIIQWIDQLVAEGITTVRDVQAILKHNVQTRMSDIVAPDEEDRGYYPTLKDIANHIYKSKVKRRTPNLDLGLFSTEAQIHSISDQGANDDITYSSPLPHLQLDEPHSICEHTIETQEVTGCVEEAAQRERAELHKELNAIRKSSSKCVDAVRLAELKAGIKALHDKFRSDLQKPAMSTHTQMLKRKEGVADTPPPAKMARVDTHDHAYWTLQE
ncbi:calcium-responsive transcription factor-like [Aulostomus maculatus]